MEKPKMSRARCPYCGACACSFCVSTPLNENSFCRQCNKELRWVEEDDYIKGDIDRAFTNLQIDEGTILTDVKDG